MNAIPQKVLRQWVVGYNFTTHYSESVVASLWLMSDGDTQVLYDGYRTKYMGGMIQMVDYGTVCPTLDRLQEVAP